MRTAASSTKAKEDSEAEEEDTEEEDAEEEDAEEEDSEEEEGQSEAPYTHTHAPTHVPKELPVCSATQRVFVRSALPIDGCCLVWSGEGGWGADAWPPLCWFRCVSGVVLATAGRAGPS